MGIKRAKMQEDAILAYYDRIEATGEDSKWERFDEWLAEHPEFTGPASSGPLPISVKRCESILIAYLSDCRREGRRPSSTAYNAWRKTEENLDLEAPSDQTLRKILGGSWPQACKRLELRLD